MEDSNYELAVDRSHPQFSVTSVNSRCSRPSRRSSCRICLSSIQDPAALTCGHQFCEDCLETYWDVKDRPNFIVCPLCRACAYNVDFIKKEDLHPTAEEFRKTFNILENIPETVENSTSIQCLKLSLLVPAVYCVLKWLKIPLAEILTFLQLKLRRV